MASVFSKIISGEIPSIKVHEDERTLAIMDINPIQRGQILVIPKVEVGDVLDLPDADFQALMNTVKRAGLSIRKAFPDKARVGVMVEGLEVTDHAHVKVFPFSSVREYHADPAPVDQAELQQLAVKLAF